MDFGVDLAVIGFRQQQFSVPHFSRYVETAKGMYITKKNSGTDRVIAEVLAPMLNGSADEIRRRFSSVRRTTAREIGGDKDAGVSGCSSSPWL
jgi:hypothetical protein